MRIVTWVAAAALLLRGAPAALAHEGSPNFLSQVNSVSPQVDGVAVEVLNRDDRLLLRNESGKTVVIEGYSSGRTPGSRPTAPSRSTATPRPTTSTRSATAGSRCPRAWTRRASPSGRRSRRPAASSGTTTACTGWPRTTPSRSRTRRCARRCSTGRCRSTSAAGRERSRARCPGPRWHRPGFGILPPVLAIAALVCVACVAIAVKRCRRVPEPATEAW